MPSPPTHALGIDPGLEGALCLYEIATKRIWVFDMPVAVGSHRCGARTRSHVDPARLAAIVDQFKFQAGPGRLHAAVELVGSMPRQAGAFNFGVSAGVVHGVLGALSIPMALIPPAVWKQAMGLRRIANESQAGNKTRARELAMKIFPEQAALFARVKDDGRAESVLLSFFYAQKMGWV